MQSQDCLRFSSLFAAVLLFGVSPDFGAHVATHAIQSVSMRKAIPLTIVTPDTYSANANAYPTIYLLHGYGQNHASWVKEMPITASLADRYDIILVCPDGGTSSWYWDSPVDSSFQYETHVITEVVPFVDATYQTIKARTGRAITGLSMGGHGGLWLGFRHQDVFGAAGSMAGGVDIRPFPENWEMARWLGDYATHPENWESHTVINQTHLLKKNSLPLIIDCGIDDFFCAVNRRLHEKLLYLNIPHDYIERPGVHELPYWNVAVEYQVLFFRKFFDQPAAQPREKP